MTLILKRFFRTEFIFIWLIVLFIVYVITNQFFIRWISDSQNQLNLPNNDLDKLKLLQVQKQIVILFLILQQTNLFRHYLHF